MQVGVYFAKKVVSFLGKSEGYPSRFHLSVDQKKKSKHTSTGSNMIP